MQRTRIAASGPAVLPRNDSVQAERGVRPSSIPSLLPFGRMPRASHCHCEGRAPSRGNPFFLRHWCRFSVRPAPHIEASPPFKGEKLSALLTDEGVSRSSAAPNWRQPVMTEGGIPHQSLRDSFSPSAEEEKPQRESVGCLQTAPMMWGMAVPIPRTWPFMQKTRIAASGPAVLPRNDSGKQKNIEILFDPYLA